MGYLVGDGCGDGCFGADLPDFPGFTRLKSSNSVEFEGFAQLVRNTCQFDPSKGGGTLPPSFARILRLGVVFRQQMGMSASGHNNPPLQGCGVTNCRLFL